MKATRLGAFFILITFLVPLSAPAQLSCRAVFSTRQAPRSQVDPVLPNRLTDYYKHEIEGLSNEEIAERNAKDLSAFQNAVPPLTKNRAHAISYKALSRVLKILKGEKYFANQAEANYEREVCNIGYCFGRASFIHFILLKMGLQKESVRKIWLLGKHQLLGQEFEWDNHVATVVYTKEKGWVVVDSMYEKPQRLQDWAASQLSHSTDERARIYITTADKFSVDLGRYDRVNLGLTLSREEDWYQHYFVDQLKFIRENSLESLGLKPLERSGQSRTLKERIQDFFNDF